MPDVLKQEPQATGFTLPSITEQHVGPADMTTGARVAVSSVYGSTVFVFDFAATQYLTAEDAPSLAAVWDNDYDAIYDNL